MVRVDLTAVPSGLASKMNRVQSEPALKVRSHPGDKNARGKSS